MEGDYESNLPTNAPIPRKNKFPGRIGGRGRGVMSETLPLGFFKYSMRPHVDTIHEDSLPCVDEGDPVDASFYNSPNGQIDEEERDYEQEAGRDKVWHGCATFYPSVLRITPNDSVCHLFQKPVELLAHCTQFQYINGILCGVGAIKPVHLSTKGMYPELTRVQFLCIQAEEVATAYARLDTCKEKKRYFSNLRVLKFMRSTFDALLLAYQEIKLRASKRTQICVEHLPSRRAKAVRRFKDKLVLEPAQTARDLKSLAGAMRAWHFGAKFPEKHPLANLAPDEKWQALTFSYLARALPPPPRDLSELDKLADRLCKTVPPVEDPLWRPWLKSYFERFKLKTPPDLWTMPSGHAGLGYTRKRGGHARGVQDLVLFGFTLFQKQRLIPRECFPVLQSFGFEVDMTKMYPLTGVGGNESLRLLAEMSGKYDLEGLFTVARSAGFWRKCLTLGTIVTLETIDRIPVLALYAEEKGLKVRFPTCTLTAANLVYQILRRAVESHMKLDRRVSEGLGGRKKSFLGETKEDSIWYSQDMSYATDLHPFWLTGGIYLELAEIHPELKKYTRWFDKLFGSKKLVQGDAVPPAPESSFLIAQPNLEILDGSSLEERGFPGSLTVERNTVPRAVDFRIKKWADCNAFERIQKQKASKTPVQAPSRVFFVSQDRASYANQKFQQGPSASLQYGTGVSEDPESVPMIMLCEKYSKSYIQWLKLINAAEGQPTSVGAMMGDATSFPGMSLLSMYCAEAVGLPSDEGAFVGDDTLFNLDNARCDLYESKMASMGGVISKPKTFRHPTLGLITERPVENGKLQKYTLLSMFVAPPGGSKGEMNYFSQPRSINDHSRRIKRNPKNNIFRFSPFFTNWAALKNMGVPVGAPEEYGGLGVPIFQPAAVKHQKWLSLLSTLRLPQLLLGTGLNPLPATASGIIRNAAREEVTTILRLARQQSRINDAILSARRQLIFDDEDNTLGLYEDVLQSVESKGSVHYSEAVETAAGPIQSWEFYTRVPHDVSHTPSMKYVARRINDKISRAPKIRKRLRWAATRRDLARKKEVYVKKGWLRDPKTLVGRSYGLEPHSEVPVNRDSTDKPYSTIMGDLGLQTSRNSRWDTEDGEQ